MKRRVYLDHSATTPVDTRVASVVSKYMLEWFGNPSSIHAFGQEAKTALENARESIARLLNCKPDEIYFTSGGTESDNLALLGYASRHRDRGRHIILGNLEHPAVHKAGKELQRRGFDVEWVPADRYGEVHAGDVTAALRDDTILVSVMHVNNEVGTINDIGAVGRILRERGVAFHSDAVQSFGKVPIDVQAMGVDLLSLSSHKIYGPKGVGALYVRSGVELHPRLFGGHQEQGLRPGTENLPGIVGLGAAARICREEMKSEAQRLTALRERLHRCIRDHLDDISLNGSPDHRLPGNLNLTFHGIEGEALLMALDLEGIAVSTGSACSSGSTQPSRILTSMGLSPEDARSSIRFTLGRGNSVEDINYSGEVVVNAVKRLRAMSGEPVTVNATD